MGQNLDISFQLVTGPTGISVLPSPAFRYWGISKKNSISHLVQPLIQFLTCACVYILYIYTHYVIIFVYVCMCVSIGEFIHVSRSQTYCGHDPSSLYPGKRVPLGHQRLRMARNDLIRTLTWLCSLG